MGYMAGVGYDRYVGYGGSLLVMGPDCVADDIGWESVAFVGIHKPILSISAL